MKKRQEVVDYIQYWSERIPMNQGQLIKWIGIHPGRFYNWADRYELKNQHNANLPRYDWLLKWEKKHILSYYNQHPEEGYRRLSYMMLDADKVAVSPSSVYRVLKQAGKLQKWAKKPSRKGTGFNQPKKAHEHWHIDISYLNLSGTFYYLCTILDGYSRYIVHWEIREKMKEQDVEIILQRAREKNLHEKPRIISDNGPQFIARDFKEFIRISGMTHVRTSPYYPQSNGKLERWHGSLKQECIRPKTPLDLEDARKLVSEYVDNYNQIRLHSAIGYITPESKLQNREWKIFTTRKQKLELARARRKSENRVKSNEQINHIPAMAGV
ncbi:MAG: IS3 family transposase [Anaerolineaceae bacterium]|nr:IS3 family transposase [Anaerolineaceae bacterium]